MTRRLVLASSSVYRRELLERLAIPFETASPDVDEDAVKALGFPAHELVTRLALAKAEALAESFPDALIIGSDQCAELNGTLLGKPGTAARAVAQLESMSGRQHTLWTGVAVLDSASGEASVEVDEHRLTMRQLSRAQLTTYVDREQPLNCAGSYKIESGGIALFESIDGGDFTAIIGLPMLRLTRMLAARGLDPFGVA